MSLHPFNDASPRFFFILLYSIERNNKYNKKDKDTKYMMTPTRTWHDASSVSFCFTSFNACIYCFFFAFISDLLAGMSLGDNITLLLTHSHIMTPKIWNMIQWRIFEMRSTSLKNTRGQLICWSYVCRRDSLNCC